jgi:hypothetical protein
MVKVLLGCDPELFVRNPNSKAYISAHNMITGTKDHPQFVKDGMVQVDGTALEFGIDPASNEDEWVSRINSVTGQLRQMIDPGYEIVGHATATFEPAYFEALPRYAKELGCEPDYNAWSGDQNVRPKGDRPFRTGAGHIHIGWTQDQDPRDFNHFEKCREVARQMDYYLGIQSLLWDKDSSRRELYGKAGAFRPKPYGVEYRTLSNAWVNNELLMRWVYRAALKGATELLVNQKDAATEYGTLARDIIDNNVVDWQSKNKIELGLVNPPTPRMAA